MPVDMIHKFTVIVVNLGGTLASFPQPGCNGVAYRYRHRPRLGEKSDAALIESRPMASNMRPVNCLACGKPVGPMGSEPAGGWAEENEAGTDTTEPPVVDSVESPGF